MFAPIRTGSSVAAALVLGLAAAARAQDLASTPEDRKDVSLTIYNNDLSLVREVRSVPMRQGEFRLRYEGVTAGIDATTVHLEGRGTGDVSVIEQNYEYDLLSPAKLLQKYVGREVGYRIKDTGTVGRARLLAANESPVYEIDGKIMFELPGPIVLDAVPEGLAARPTLVWTLTGGRDGKQDVETAYLSSGLSWRADYVLLLEENEKSGGINGWVTLENHSGAAFENAQLKLVAGNVNRIREQMQKEVMTYAADARTAMPVPQFQEESFFEYHMYTLQRRAEIRDQQTKQVLFFDSGKVAVDKEYTFRAQPHYFVQGFDSPPGTEHVDVTLRFKNSKENGLGNPIPAGRLRVYKNDKDGAPQFLGENTVRHTPKDETLEFAVGQAFDIVGEHEQVDYRKLGDQVAEMSYRVKIRNHKQEQVQVRVLENFYGDWKIEESSHPATRDNSRTASFKLQVPPDGETVLTYRVRIET